MTGACIFRYVPENLARVKLVVEPWRSTDFDTSLEDFGVHLQCSIRRAFVVCPLVDATRVLVQQEIFFALAKTLTLRMSPRALPAKGPPGGGGPRL